MTVTATPRRTSKRRRERDTIWVDVPFVKAVSLPDAKTGDIELNGYANTWGMDRDDEMVAADAFDRSLPDYLSKNPMVLWQHNMDWPIGFVKGADLDETGLAVKAIVPDPGEKSAEWQRGAYTAIKTGVVRTFSIGGYMYRDVKPGPDGPVFIITEVELFEISVVSIPANADSLYEAAVKSIAGSPARMSEKATGQMEQLLGLQLVSDPELLAMSEDGRRERYKLLAELFRDAHDGAEPPEYEAWRKVDAAKRAGVSPLKVAAAVSAIARAFYYPEGDGKQGRAISAANRSKLEAALAAHDKMEEHLVSMAEEMKSAAGAHADSMQALKDVLGIEDDEEEEPEEPPAEEAGAEEEPAKAAAEPEGKAETPAAVEEQPAAEAEGEPASEGEPEGEAAAADESEQASGAES